MSILPILAYGDPVLREKARFIEPEHPGLPQLIEDMWETMYKAQGVGLAAPQVGQAIRLFVIDARPFADEEPGLSEFKQVFINPEILEQSGQPWLFNEGCLSFPELREDIRRQPIIRMRYQDEHFERFEESFSGLKARIIQHEYDHIEGILMVDHFSPLKKRLLRKRLANIMQGQVAASYPMKFTSRKR